LSIRICSFGELGAGKSLTILYELLRWMKTHPGIHVYSNMPLIGIEFTRIDDPDILFNIDRESAVILDELWHIADSRKSMSVVNDIMNMLLIRSRKRHWFVGYTQQHWMQTDKRIRFITELWIEPRMIKPWLNMKYYSKEGTLLGERTVDASQFWDRFDSEADPYTLNVERLEALYKKYVLKRYGS
jgi:hypothetical protein